MKPQSPSWHHRQQIIFALRERGGAIDSDSSGVASTDLEKSLFSKITYPYQRKRQMALLNCRVRQIDIIETGYIDRVGITPETHLEKFISVIPVPYYLGWLLYAMVFFSISCLVLMLFEKSFRYIDGFLIISAIISLQGTAINWAHNRIKSFHDILPNIVNLPREVIIKSFDAQEANIFDDKKMVIFAIIFIIFVHISGIDYHAISFNSSISDIIFKLGYYFAVYIEGAGFYILIMTAWTVHKIGKLPLQVSALFSDFHAIGMLYSKFTIYAASAYVMWGIFHMIVPPQFSSLKLILWFSSFAILLFGYFILPQVSIHRMMTSTKKEKIEMFSSQMSAALEEPFRNPNKDNASYLKDMLSVQNQLNQMCDWPFGIYEILQIALIIVIPLIVVLLEIFYGIIK